eukprot:444150_1
MDTQLHAPMDESVRVSIPESDKTKESDTSNSVSSGLMSRIHRLKSLNQQIVKISENEPKHVWKIKRIADITHFVMKTLLSYATVMFLCLSFVFTSNIVIEIVLFVFDTLTTSETTTEKLSNVFVYVPLALFGLQICWQLTHLCWKSSILIWSMKYDRYYFHFCCNVCTLSVGTLFRSICVTAIIGLTIYKTVQETQSEHSIIEMNDLAILRNLTVVSMCIGGVLSVSFVILALLWRIWIIFICIDMDSLYKFFLLTYKIDLDVWSKANKTMGFNNAICNEMKSKFKQHQRHEALKKKFDDLENHDLLQNQTEFKFIRRQTNCNETTTTQSNQNHRITYLVRQFAVIWYVVQVMIVYKQRRGKKFLFSCAFVPLLLYFLLLTRQCKVKLFQYLSGLPSARGPSIMKILLSIWCIMGFVFVFEHIFFEYMGITQLQLGAEVKLMDESVAEPRRGDRDSFASIRRRDRRHGLANMKYPLCQIQSERDVLLDSVFFSKLAYEKDMGVIEGVMNKYLHAQDRENPWTIRNKASFITGDSPVFLHLEHKDDPTQHMIINRGTSGKHDYYEDLSLYSENIALAGFSKLFPIKDLWPDELIRSFIKALSVTEGIIFADAENHHHNGVLEYIRENVFNASVPIENYTLIVAGHSLGGAVSHIVAARLKEEHTTLPIRSIGISNPGVFYSSDKFGIDANIVSRIATTIMPDLDPVPRMDLQTGQIHHVQCKAAIQRKCHSVKQTMFEVYDACFSSPPEDFAEFMERWRGTDKLSECIDLKGKILSYLPRSKTMEAPRWRARLAVSSCGDLG